MRRKQPNADTIGRELQTQGYVILEGKRFNQTSDNCFDIACYLADKFGYQHPENIGILKEKADHNKGVQHGWFTPSSYEKPSEACFIIRTPETVSLPISGKLDPTHIVFELFGKEYNYGANTKDGFPIERRLYLRKIANS
jgi:hypothetical protein